ncbi:hypothetical protein Tco_0522489 [Tanacetum coccineum]
MIQLLWGLFHNHTLDYVALIWDEFKLQITSRRTRPSKADKLPFPRFTKLIIAHIMSNNNTINQRSDADMHRSEMDESVESEILSLERIEREQRTIDDEIDNDLDDTLEAMNTQKMKGIAEYETEETKIPTDA